MSLTTRQNFSNAILNYGPSLPAGPVADGTLFHLTSGATGLYVYNFRQDVTLGVAGDQVGQGWQLLATTGPIDAATLDGLDSTAFQLRDADLTALSNLSGIGFAVRTAPDTWATRSLAGGLGITLSNTNGSVGDITIGVSEGSLNLNNLAGTLSVAKGGTGNAGVLTPGAVWYSQTSSLMANTAVGSAGQVLLSGGAGAPVWTNQSSLSVGTATNASFATSAGSATTATSAGSASTVPWTGVTGKPTTLAGFGITDSVTKAYVDGADYLNLPPLAGVLRDNTVPVYSDFKFSQGAWNTSTYTLVDREGKQVKYYSTTTPLKSNNTFRAYRYSDADAWIFDNEPVSVGFALATEKVAHMMNCGTNFVVLQLMTKALPQVYTRTVIATTNGSSDTADWILLADVSSISASGHPMANYSVVQTTSGPRILVVYSTGGHSVYLDVYNTSLTLLRTLTLHDAATMVNTGDTLGQGRVAPAPTAISLFNYSGLGIAYPFTWNPFTEKFHMHCGSYYVWTQPGGAQVGQGIGVSISWSIPKSWIESGSGTPSNLIPIKSGSFRYNFLPDSTWGTQTGGMSNTWIGGNNVSLITDEYTGQIIATNKPSFDSMSTGLTYRYAAGFGYQTFDTTLLAPQQLVPNYGMNIPDGSAWSKLLRSFWGHVIGNQVLMNTFSTQYGDKFVQAQFSTTQFTSAANPNDTLKLDSPSAVLSPENLPSVPSAVHNGFGAPGHFGVTVVSGTPTYYFNRHGQPVYTITASGSNRTYTPTGLTMPTLPSTISGITGIVTQDLNAWNLSTSSPVFYSVVRSGTGQAYVAKYSGGSWSIPASNLFQAEIDAGKANRGDGLNEIYFTVGGQALLTEGGRFMFGFAVNWVGGTAWHYGSYDVNTNVVTSGSMPGSFQSVQTSPGYEAPGGYPGHTFGYSTTLGYYAYVATNVYDAAYFLSSRDVRTGATITENQWATGSATRFQIYLTTESATGLVAYISSYPLFIGGYYCTTPTQSISLAPSVVNYVYATKNPADRTTVDITTSTTLLPSSFSRALLAAITTNATNIVSSVLYPVAQEDAVEDLSNVTVVAKQVNDALSWNGTQWVNAPVVRTDETRSGAFAINGALVSGSRDLFTYGVSSASPTLAPSQVNLAGALTATGSVTAAGGGGLARAILQPGGGGVTGAIDFHSVIGREGYIGRGASVSSADGGTINYVSGSHSFTGSMLVSGEVRAGNFFKTTGGSFATPAITMDLSVGSAQKAAMWYSSNVLDVLTIGINGGQQFSFESAGTFTASGDIVAYSDAKLKTNVRTIENAVQTVNALRGVTFDRISNGQKSLGVIAQEVQAVLPELVSTSEDGTLGVAYGNMVGVLIEAIKEQQKQIDALRAEVQELKKA